MSLTLLEINHARVTVLKLKKLNTVAVFVAKKIKMITPYVTRAFFSGNQLLINATVAKCVTASRLKRFYISSTVCVPMLFSGKN